jgi:hypothetical protein
MQKRLAIRIIFHLIDRSIKWSVLSTAKAGGVQSSYRRPLQPPVHTPCHRYDVAVCKRCVETEFPPGQPSRKKERELGLCLALLLSSSFIKARATYAVHAAAGRIWSHSHAGLVALSVCVRCCHFFQETAYGPWPSITGSFFQPKTNTHPRPVGPNLVITAQPRSPLKQYSRALGLAQGERRRRGPGRGPMKAQMMRVVISGEGVLLDGIF